MFEFLFDILLELLFGLAAEVLFGLMEDSELSGPVVTAIRLILLGTVAGFLSVWIFPSRLIAKPLVPSGTSLLLAPLVTGLAMYLIGRRLRHLKREASSLATFWGGALFAFCMSVVRGRFVGPPQ